MLIETQTASGGTVASFAFPSGGGSLPTTFTHLELIMTLRSSSAITTFSMQLATGGGAVDTGANYMYVAMNAPDDGVFGFMTSAYDYTANGLQIGTIPAVADYFAVVQATIPYYNATTNYKTCIADCGATLTGSPLSIMSLTHSTWSNTGAITSLLVLPDSGLFAQYSSVSLYGIP